MRPMGPIYVSEMTLGEPLGCSEGVVAGALAGAAEGALGSGACAFAPGWFSVTVAIGLELIFYVNRDEGVGTFVLRLGLRDGRDLVKTENIYNC